ncbi:DUF5688 family protein [Lachnospiraceae bacterium KK002]
MNYEEFKTELQEKIQERFLQNIDFVSNMVTLTNETVEGMALKFEGSQGMDLTIYPNRLYEKYKRGISVTEMAEYFSKEISYALAHKPAMPEITVENAASCVRFSLINKERNKELLEKCPHIDVFDMAGVIRWHISEKESFLVDTNVMQKLQMTREELLMIAKKNTENQKFICEEMTGVMREIMLKNGIEKEVVDEIIPMQQTPFYVVTTENYFDGSVVMLSNTFLQKVANQLNCDELYIIPSSRHEILVANPNLPLDSQALKDIVMEVHEGSQALKAEDFLSNSVYKYNAKSFTFSICDSKGLFQDKGTKKHNAKRDSGKGRKL